MALKFQAYLETWHLNSLVVKYGDVCREEEVKPITVAEHSLVQVHLDDYVALDYESPLQILYLFALPWTQRLYPPAVHLTF